MELQSYRSYLRGLPWPTAALYLRRRGGDGQSAARLWRSKCILHQRAVSMIVLHWWSPKHRHTMVKKRVWTNTTVENLCISYKLYEYIHIMIKRNSRWPHFGPTKPPSYTVIWPKFTSFCFLNCSKEYMYVQCTWKAAVGFSGKISFWCPWYIVLEIVMKSCFKNGSVCLETNYEKIVSRIEY